MQRSPPSSLRPKKRSASRWGQCWYTKPTFPLLSRRATRFSPSSRTRTGSQSGSGRSSDTKKGSQYLRINCPMLAFPSTRVSFSFSSGLSIDLSLFHGLCLPDADLVLGEGQGYGLVLAPGGGRGEIYQNGLPPGQRDAGLVALADEEQGLDYAVQPIVRRCATSVYRLHLDLLRPDRDVARISFAKLRRLAGPAVNLAPFAV